MHDAGDDERAHARSRDGSDTGIDNFNATNDFGRATARDEDASSSDKDGADDGGEDDAAGVSSAPNRMSVVKAPRLEQDAIDRLTIHERKLVLGRWNARLRGLKRRVDDIATQFPTSSVVLLFTKPFQTKRRYGRWCVRFQHLARVFRTDRLALACFFSRTPGLKRNSLYGDRFVRRSWRPAHRQTKTKTSARAGKSCANLSRNCCV